MNAGIEKEDITQDSGWGGQSCLEVVLENGAAEENEQIWWWKENN